MNYKDDNAPSWFIEAVNTPYKDHFIDVDGCRIHYQHWHNEGDKPGLLFVHGGGAHSHWWDFIAPAFLQKFDVAAIDISGMGNSEHREQYTSYQFAKELMAVIDDAGFGDNAIIAAHSFGGLAALRAGIEYAERLRGLVVIDSAIFPPNFQANNDMKGSPFKSKKVYPDVETAMTRFKLVPPQPCENTYIVNYIGRHSMGEVEGGWSWKFDMQFLQKTQMDDLQQEIKKLKLKTSIIYGEKSMLFLPPLLEYMKTVYSDDVPFKCLPNAAHHLFLDQPLEFIKLLDEVLETY